MACGVDGLLILAGYYSLRFVSGHGFSRADYSAE
jgi:hypothetical protein